MYVNELGAMANADVPPEFTFRITGTVVEVDPDVIVMKPAYAPVAIVPGFTDTVSTVGVVPEVGVTCSQFPLDKVVTLKVAAAALVDVTSRFCEGVVTFAVVLNVNCVGLTAIGF